MKKFIFKTISVFLILTYISNFCLYGTGFAEEAQAVSTSSSESLPAVPAGSSAQPASQSLAAAALPIPSPDYHQYSGGGGFNLSVLQGFQEDGYTGQAKFGVPIVTPLGRNGIQANISLAYSSDLGSGILGKGWFLGLGSIERSTKKGAPKYDATDTFVFNFGGASSELVSIGVNEYRLKLEGSFMRFIFDGTSWQVTDKTGTKYYFGSSGNSRQDNDNPANSPTQWCLDKIVDRLGNYLTASYIKDQGQIYPDKVKYTGNEINADVPLNQVEFAYELRNDSQQSYRNGRFKVCTAYRLSEILVKANSQLQRRYKFLYAYSSYTHRSLLTTIRQYGADNVTTLPDLIFNYQSGSPGWELATNYTIPADACFSSAGTWLYDNGVRIADVNADGFSDIVKSVTNIGGARVSVTYLNDKAGSFSAAANWIPSFVFLKLFNGNQDNGARLVDINGDGWQDIVRSFRNASGVTTNNVYMNVQSGIWSNYSSTWQLPSPDLELVVQQADGSFQYQGCVLEDINGDGLVDYVKAKGSDRRSYINNGNGAWQAQSSFNLSDGDFTQGAVLADINGDGLNDMLIAESGRRLTYINNGSGWQRDSAFDMPDGSFNDGSTQVVDVNADGLPDIVYAKDGVRKTYVNNGYQFLGAQPGLDWQMPDGDFANLGTRFLDANGDGMMDFMVYYNGQPAELYLNKAEVSPDLLSSVSNGLGGQTQVIYKPSTQFDNTGSDNKPDLTFPVYAVDSITSSDGQGNSYATTYAYKDGLFNSAEREFRGFGYVKVTDAEGNYTENYFKQDNIYKGRLYKQETRDKNGNLYTAFNNTWNSTEVYPGVHFPFLSQVYSSVYDGDSTSKTTSTRFEYDAYGNTARIVSEGDVNVTGDKKIQVIDYVYNTVDWLVSFPKRSYVLDENQARVSDKYFYYDNANATTAPPVKGLLTQEKTWLYNPLTQTQSSISNYYAYDSYGNVTTNVDALGRYITTAYDILTHSYPVKIINALGHTVNTVYYGINDTDPLVGAGLSGQAKYIEDPNKQKSLNIYDTLGRLTKSIGPNDTEIAPGTIYEYDLTNRPVKITQKVKTDYAPSPNYYITYSFYDGLGRLIQAKSPAENNPSNGVARQIVSGIAKFDLRGQVKEKYISYFAPASTDYLAPAYDTPHSISIYDPIGRLTEVINPDGTYSTISYSDWVITKTDANSHYNSEYYDAYGKLIKKEEHKGSLTYTTNYEYDVQGNLTKVTDNQNNITRIWYDSLGRKIRMDDPDMGVWNYEYDSVGNLKKQLDAKGQVIDFTYDKINRLTYKFYNGLAGVYYEYDNVAKGNCIGRLSRAISLNDVTEFFYDNLGREIKSTKIINGGTLYTVERAYNALDRLVTLKYPGNEIVAYTYNNSGAIERVAGNSVYVSNIDYSPTGQITKIQYGNGVETNYAYNPNTLRLSNLITNSGVVKLQNLNYQFDNVGNVSAITDYVNTASQAFLYDDLGRLTQATGSYGVSTYDYDSIGNMISKEAVSLAYGKADKLPHAVTQYGSTLIDYDSNGNMIKKGDTEFSYDIENRLTQVKQPQNKYTTILYDGDGGRIKKYEGSGQDYTDTTYIGSLFESESIQSAGQASSKFTKHIFAGANRVATVTVNPVIPAEAGIQYYHSDHLGSSNVITDSTGNQVNLTEFTPYGSTFKQTGSSDPEYKFTGKELDSSGLYFYGARYYDPELGRFITADTIVQAPYDSQSLNRYAYCRNNPINYTDPTGHNFWEDLGEDLGSFLLGVASVIVAPFCGGLSIALWAASAIVSGIQAAQSGQFGMWFAGFTLSFALGSIFPASNFENLGLQIGVGALRGATIGAISGGLVSLMGGGSFGTGASQGAIGGAQGGALGGLMSSQQVGNYSNGDGFRTDAQVQTSARRVVNMMAMLDEARAQGGSELQFKTVIDISSANSSIEGRASVLSSVSNSSSASAALTVSPNKLVIIKAMYHVSKSLSGNSKALSSANALLQAISSPSENSANYGAFYDALYDVGSAIFELSLKVLQKEIPGKK